MRVEIRVKYDHRVCRLVLISNGGPADKIECPQKGLFQPPEDTAIRSRNGGSGKNIPQHESSRDIRRYLNLRGWIRPYPSVCLSLLCYHPRPKFIKIHWIGLFTHKSQVPVTFAIEEVLDDIQGDDELKTINGHDLFKTAWFRNTWLKSRTRCPRALSLGNRTFKNRNLALASINFSWVSWSGKPRGSMVSS